jgi:hypothetical protein
LLVLAIDLIRTTTAPKFGFQLLQLFSELAQSR